METKESTSWDGEHVLTYRDTGKTHIYTLDGVRVPGATTIGASYPKGDGLIRWMIREGLEEYDKRTKLNKAGAIGRVVHKYAEAAMMGLSFNWDLVDQAEDAAIIRDCIKQYDARAAEFPDDAPIGAELLVASTSLNVASQIDLIKRRGSKVIITDYKTGKKIYVSALHQTALYRRMAKEWLNLDVEELEVLKFSKEPDTYPFETCIVRQDEMVLNGERLEYRGILDELDRQAIRNTQTYRHANGVEKLLTKYYESRR